MSSSELENKFLNESIDEETLERIRNIRSSERRFYQKITDIYSSCSIDYDKDSEITKIFLKQFKANFIMQLRGILLLK